MPFAIGTGLANITGQSALATVKHRKMGNIDLALGVPVGLCMVFGVEGGARLVLWLEQMGLADQAIRWFYTLFLSGLGVLMLVEYVLGKEQREEQRANAENGEDPPAATAKAGVIRKYDFLKVPPTVHLRSCELEISLWVLGVTGVTIGFLAGIMGAGGGFALVPVFVFLVGTPTYVAVGTSLVCVMISGAYGAFTYALKGRTELVAALLMMTGAAIGAQLGSAAIRHVHGAGVRLLYSLSASAGGRQRGDEAVRLHHGGGGGDTGRGRADVRLHCGSDVPRNGPRAGRLGAESWAGRRRCGGDGHAMRGYLAWSRRRRARSRAANRAWRRALQKAVSSSKSPLRSGSPTTMQMSVHGFGMTKASQLARTHASRTATPNGQTGKPERRANSETPCCTEYRGPRGPSGVIAGIHPCSMRRSMLRSSLRLPREVEPRTEEKPKRAIAWATYSPSRLSLTGTQTRRPGKWLSMVKM